jgi:hypothetical protein
MSFGCVCDRCPMTPPKHPTANYAPVERYSCKRSGERICYFPRKHQIKCAPLLRSNDGDVWSVRDPEWDDFKLRGGQRWQRLSTSEIKVAWGLLLSRGLYSPAHDHDVTTLHTSHFFHHCELFWSKTWMWDYQATLKVCTQGLQSAFNKVYLHGMRTRRMWPLSRSITWNSIF